jgi:serine protease Do
MSLARILGASLGSAATLLLAAQGSFAQPAARPAGVLRELNSSVEALVRQVSPSVVQVVVTGYAPREGASGNSPFDIVRQVNVGSGVILDPEGYIVTNAHVVAGAERVQVVLSGAADGETPAHSTGPVTKTFDAQVIGAAQDIDLAVLKIDASNLPALTIGDYERVHKGDIVFALGSPNGLRDSVTMGVVSTVARQLDPDSPLVYIQTDAPINPGNSGGPLVNVDGELVGINTFMLANKSAGSQGPGFAIPSALVASTYPKLCKYGHLVRDEIGVRVQGVTPGLASGLRLARDWGVIVADVVEGGPADDAGIRVQDIITSVDGRPTTSVPLFSMQLNTHRDPYRVVLGVLRGTSESSVSVGVLSISTNLTFLTQTPHLELKPIDRLGILAVEVDDLVALLLPSLRIPSGIVVAARTEHWVGPSLRIAPGDVIHSINGTPVVKVDGILSSLKGITAGQSIVLQVERDGQLTFIAVEPE